MTIHSGPLEDGFAQAVKLAQRATLGQSSMTGYPDTAPVALNGYALPSEALLALTTRHGVVPSAEQAAALGSLDALVEPLRGALARFVDAFLALDTAARVDLELTQFVDEQALEFDGDGIPGFVRRGLDTSQAEMAEAGAASLSTGSERVSMAEDFGRLGVDFSRMFPTRAQFLDAIAALRSATALTAPPTAGACAPVAMWPVFSIDVATCNNVYHSSYALQLDLGGGDWYDNNAGGSNIWGGYFCDLIPPGMRAAAVDLGGANDLYGDPASPRFCGVNGGGFLGGMGFLLDDGGADEYVAGCGGHNGGAFFAASGFLLDVGGSDRYTVTCLGNGAGIIAWGMLIDTGGDDVFTGGPFGGTNGEGSGDLFTFRATVLKHGLGFLLDTAGNDAFVGAMSANGGGYNGGQGFLVDLQGDDQYLTNGDTANGGARFPAGAGFLLDRQGDDTYRAANHGTNGGGGFGGSGMLIDLQGSDAYDAASWGTNGGGTAAGAGHLLDLMGDDTYTSGHSGTNGAGGASSVLVTIPVGSGLLLDGGGSDSYRDALVACGDCSIVPKGTFGAQLDL